jgi:hypothetical protein
VFELVPTLMGSEAAFTFGHGRATSIAQRLRHRGGGVERLVRPLRPLHALRTRGAAPEDEADEAPPVAAESAADVLADRERVASLLERVEWPADRIVVRRDADYLHWRYGLVGGYSALCREEGGRMRGLVVFRTAWHGRTSRMNVCDLFVEEGDGRLARQLLRQALRASRVDYASCTFAAHSVERRAALATGFVRMGSGVSFFAKPLVEGLQPDPGDLRSWALTNGEFDHL